MKSLPLDEIEKTVELAEVALSADLAPKVKKEEKKGGYLGLSERATKLGIPDVPASFGNRKTRRGMLKKAYRQMRKKEK